MAPADFLGALRDLSDLAVPGSALGESRILYHRRIHDRVKKIAPFITFDRDAYLVIGQEGRLFWILDGYTTFGALSLLGTAPAAKGRIIFAIR